MEVTRLLRAVRPAAALALVARRGRAGRASIGGVADGGGGGLAAHQRAPWSGSSSTTSAPNAYVEGVLRGRGRARGRSPGSRRRTAATTSSSCPVDDDGDAHPEHLGHGEPLLAHDPDAAARRSSGRSSSDGELPDPAVETEVLVDEEMAELYDLEAGDHAHHAGLRAWTSSSSSSTDIGTPGAHRRRCSTSPSPASSAGAAGRGAARRRCPRSCTWAAPRCYLGPAFDAAHRRVDVPSLGALFGDVGPAGGDGLRAPRRLRRDDAGRQLAAAIAALDPEALVDFSGERCRTGQAEEAEPIDPAAGRRSSLALGAARGDRRASCCITQALRRQLEADRDVQRSLVGPRDAEPSSAMRLAAVKGALVGAAGARWSRRASRSPSRRSPRSATPAGPRSIPACRDRRAACSSSGALALLLVVVASRCVDAAWRASVGRHSRGGRAGRRAWAPPTAPLAPGMPPPIVAGVRAARLGSGRGTAVVATVFVAAARDRGRARASRPARTGSPPTPTSGAGTSTWWSATATTRPFDEQIEASLAGNPMIDGVRRAPRA